MSAPLDISQILDKEGRRGVDVFKKAIEPHKATSKTAQSAYYKVEGKGASSTSLTILSRPYTTVLEKGSKPADTHKPPKGMIDELTHWAKARGIPEEAVYGIAVNLLKEGQRVNRNVYSEQMQKFADEVADEVTKQYAGYAIDTLLNQFTK